MTTFLLAFAWVSIFSKQAWHVELGDQVIEVVAGFKDDVASPSAVASIRPPFWLIGLSAKGYATGPAVAGARIDFHLIDEHEEIVYETTKKARR